jgi:chromosome segregation ATPase
VADSKTDSADVSNAANPTPSGDWNYSAQLNRIEHTLQTVLAGLQGTLSLQAAILNDINKVLGQELSLNKKEKQIMADVKIAQETLDADGDKLTQLAADLKSLIDGGTLSDADQTKLQAGLDALTSLDTVPVTPPPTT